jgi:hypothetical protein
VEQQLGVLVAQAYAIGFTEEAHLAAMAGISPDAVHRSLWRRRRAGP